MPNAMPSPVDTTDRYHARHRDRAAGAARGGAAQPSCSSGGIDLAGVAGQRSSPWWGHRRPGGPRGRGSRAPRWCMVRTVEREEKLVHGRDDAQAELRNRDELERRNAEELPAAAMEAVEYGSLQLRGQLLGAVRMILEEQDVELSQFTL